MVSRFRTRVIVVPSDVYSAFCVNRLGVKVLHRQVLRIGSLENMENLQSFERDAMANQEFPCRVSSVERRSTECVYNGVPI
jgi:hypothetical protein